MNENIIMWLIIRYIYKIIINILILLIKQIYFIMNVTSIYPYRPHTTTLTSNNTHIIPADPPPPGAVYTPSPGLPPGHSRVP